MGNPDTPSKNRFGISIINVPVSPMNDEAVFESGPLGYGHKAVTKSIIRGLKAIGCPFNFNPSSEKDIYSTGFFTYQIECELHLRQLLDFRKKGVIRQLFGFCIVDHPFYEAFYEEIDVFFTLTPWLFRAKDVSCPVSCDMSLFQRTTIVQDQKAVTVYYKNREGNEAIANAIEPTKAYLEKKGIPYHLLEYGFGDSGYSYQQLIEALNNSYAMIVLDTWETQGIFLHESWSMDVPTFILDVYDPESTHRFQMVRAAPYIAPENGAVWRTFDQLDQLLVEYQTQQLLFHPRKWCEENMNDITLAETIVKEMMVPSDFRIFQKTRSFAHIMQ